jgi:hypothetical protein
VLPNVIEVSDEHGDMRANLNIPETAIVFGRYGGYRQFNIGYVKDTVIKTAKENGHIYFVFMNTEPFSENVPNIIYLPGTRDLRVKRRFINTCNAMLHGRAEGETFGCACGEFALCKKWVITAASGDVAHVKLLRKQVLLYESPSSLEHVLVNFKKLHDRDPTPNYHSYGDYVPNMVMSHLRHYIGRAIKMFGRKNE